MTNGLGNKTLRARQLISVMVGPRGAGVARPASPSCLAPRADAPQIAVFLGSSVLTRERQHIIRAAPQRPGGHTMKLTPPAKITWIIALVVGVLGIVAQQGIFRIPGLGIQPFWLVTIGYLLLLIAPLVR